MYNDLIRKYANLRGIPYEYLYNQIKTESNFNPKALGDNGKSYGLMQINESVAKDFKVPSNIFGKYDKLFDPEYNIDIGTQYLKKIESMLGPYLPSDSKTRWALIFMAYNSGPYYTFKALKRLKDKGIKNPSLQQVIDEMNSPGFGKTPIFSITLNYVKKITGLIANAPANKTSLLAMLLLTGLLILYVKKQGVI